MGTGNEEVGNGRSVLAELGPGSATPRPAMEAVTITREGESWVAEAWRRGANLNVLISLA